MKKRIIASLAIVAVFGLAIAAFAYNQNSNTAGNASCCAKSDSCPMKAKTGHDTAGKHSGESCPMKAKHGENATAEGQSGCDCCGDSCPMKKDGEAKATAVSATEEGKDCDCCKGKHDTAV